MKNWNCIKRGLLEITNVIKDNILFENSTTYVLINGIIFWDLLFKSWTQLELRFDLETKKKSVASFDQYTCR